MQKRRTRNARPYNGRFYCKLVGATIGRPLCLQAGAYTLSCPSMHPESKKPGELTLPRFLNVYSENYS